MKPRRSGTGSFTDTLFGLGREAPRIPAKRWVFYRWCFSRPWTQPLGPRKSFQRLLKESYPSLRVMAGPDPQAVGAVNSRGNYMQNKAFVKIAGQFHAGKIITAACAMVFLLGAATVQGA